VHILIYLINCNILNIYYLLSGNYEEGLKNTWQINREGNEEGNKGE